MKLYSVQLYSVLPGTTAGNSVPRKILGLTHYYNYNYLPLYFLKQPHNLMYFLSEFLSIIYFGKYTSYTEKEGTVFGLNTVY